MTAVTLSQESVSESPNPLQFAGIVLAVLLLAAYLVLPFVNAVTVEETSMDAVTVSQLTASRDNNPLEIPVEGLVMIPIAALGAFVLGLWNVFDRKSSRVVSILLTLMGMLALVYFVIFFRENSSVEEVDYLSHIGIGFWAMLITGTLMVLQVFIPRSLPEGEEAPSIFANQESLLAIGLLLLVVVVGIINPRFLSERNVSDVLAGNAYIAVAAIGMSMVIITGNIDISVGSLIGLAAVLSGRMVVDGSPVWLAWLAPIVVCMGVQGFIGFLVAYMRIPSIVVTLGMLSIIKGVLIIWTNGERVTGMPAEFTLAQMRPLGIPMPIYFMVILTIVAALWMRYSSFGRSLYAVGGNEEAALLSGISQKRVVLFVFIINGFFVGIASILYATQLNVIQATPPPGLELSIITASVVGGVSILGGIGTVVGSTIATVLLNSIRSAMIFINVSPFWLLAVQGIMILVTVLADLLRRRRRRI